MNKQFRSVTAFLACLLIIAIVGDCSSQEKTPLNDYWRRCKESSETSEAKIMLFTAFLKERLDITVPDWWRARLQLSSNFLGSGGPLDQTDNIESRTKRSKRTFEIVQEGGESKLRFEANDVLVDLDPVIADDERIPAASIDGLQLGDGSVLVARWRNDDQLVVARIENRAGSVWFQKKQVSNPNDRSAWYSGVGREACVEILRKKDAIVVIGAKTGVSCLFVFEPDQGDEVEAGIFDQLR